MNISLENIEEFNVPLDDYIANWIFTDESEQRASIEHEDQIFPLTKEASNFLWNYEMKLGSEFSDQKTIKKYLFKLGIPFDKKVYIAQQPDTAFVLTWKMVIKYSHNLFFANDQTVWNKTLNWKLEFHHDGEFTFGKDLIYDGQIEMIKNKEKLEEALKEMEERKKGSS
jgi:hypothetical protein